MTTRLNSDDSNFKSLGGPLRLLMNKLEKMREAQPLYAQLPDCIECNDTTWIYPGGGKGVVKCPCQKRGTQTTDPNVSKVTGSAKLFRGGRK
jgi:hypothetical protein